MPEVQLTAGPIEYRDTGGGGPVVVLIGGLAIGPTLWDGVVAALQDAHRVIVPTLPWGAHRKPMNPDADLSLPGHARIVADFLEALDLRDVTLVENDTGMAQLVAADHPQRIGRLVITSCEAFENYPPGIAGKTIGIVGRFPGGIRFAMSQLKVRPLRRLPMTFGWMTKHGIDDAMMDDWLEPIQTQREIRRDLTKYIKALDKRIFLDIAERLPSFDKPVLIAWAAEDKLMPPEHGRRFAELFPKARLVEVADSRTLIPLDQPGVLAALIAGHVRGGEVATVGGDGRLTPA